MNENNFEKLSKKFYDLLCEAFWNYYLWKEIRDFFNNKTDTSNFMDERYKEFFVPILFALQDKVILLLSNLLDWFKENNDRKVVSIFELIEFLDIEERKKIDVYLKRLEENKNKLFKWRNKVIAHKDYTLWIQGYDDFIKKYYLKFDDIFKIMLDLWKIYDNVVNITNKTKQSTLFSWIKNLSSIGFNKLINDIKYFVPIDNDERIKIISKKVEEEFNKK